VRSDHKKGRTGGRLSKLTPIADALRVLSAMTHDVVWDDPTIPLRIDHLVNAA